MIRDIALGQYIPGKSFIHRMDPRVKIALTFLFIIFLFVANGYVGMGVMVALVLAVLLLSRIPLKQYFKSLKAIIFVVAFTSILNLFYGSGRVLVQIGFMQITEGGVNRAVFITIRIVCLMLLSAALTFTTSPTALTDAIERLLRPLKVFHVKVHEIAMMMTIALRFVPTLLEETDKIMSAQKARGANMESGGFMQRVKALIPILIPLFVSAFRRAYDLAMAMECRCYHGGEGRTRMKVLKAGKSDVAVTVFSLLLCVGIVLLNIYLPGAVR